MGLWFTFNIVCGGIGIWLGVRIFGLFRFKFVTNLLCDFG